MPRPKRRKHWRRLALRALGDHDQWSWPRYLRDAVLRRAGQTKHPHQRPRRSAPTEATLLAKLGRLFALRADQAIDD